MYKKISHNITEEHFDNPGALWYCSTSTAMRPTMQPNISKGMGLGAVLDYSLGIHDPLPAYAMTEETMQFRMNSRTAWSKWVYSLLNYSISLNGSLPGTDQVKGRMHKNAVALGDFLIPFYGLTSARVLTTALIAIDDIGMHYVEALKAGQPTESVVKSWEPYIADIAKVFNELNPNNWPESLISDIFKNIAQGWQDQLTARAKGDVVADEIAIDYLNKVVVTGVPNHSKPGFASLADIFSRGIVAQFPTMFAE